MKKYILLQLITLCFVLVNVLNIGFAQEINGLTLSVNSLVIEKGTCESISVYLNNSTSISSECKWTSENPNLVSVEDGIVNGLEIGVTKVTARYGELEKSINVEVIEGIVNDFYLDKTSLDINMNSFSELSIAGYVQFTSGRVKEVTKDIKWTLSKNLISIVDGNITPLSVGTGKITAEYNDFLIEFNVNVYKSLVTDIKFSNPIISMKMDNGIQLIDVIGTFEDGKTGVINDVAKVYSNDESIVKVRYNTLSNIFELTPVSSGISSITCYYYGLSTSAKVEIIERTQKITLSETTTTGKTLVLKINQSKMQVNGVDTEIDKGRGTAPIIKNGRTLLPVRSIIESINGDVKWDSAERKITMTVGNKKVEMWIDNPKMVVGGIEKEIDPGRGTAPEIINDRTLLPIRAIAEELGGTVEWNEGLSTITIKFVD